MTLRIRGGTVLTLDAAGTVYDPGEVLIRDGRIAAVGPRTGRPSEPDKEVIDAPYGLILPGLINAHCHSSDTLVRGTAPALPLEAWSQFTEAGRFGRTPREIYLSAALTAIEALKSGTTTLLDHLRLSPGPTVEGLAAAAQAYLDTGVRAVVAPVLSDLPAAETIPLDLADLPESLAVPMRRSPVPWQEQAEVVDAFARAGGPRLGVQIGPSAPHRCSDALLERCGELSERHGVRLHTHFLETVSQAVVARRRFRQGAARHLADLGLLSRASLVHCVHADDIETIAASGAIVVHCPVANLRLASGIMAWRAFADRGVPLALGTDGVLCNDSLSLFTLMKVAALIHNEDARPAPLAMLRAAVQGGAAVCGCADDVSLTPGAQADLVVVGPALLHDPVAGAVYAAEGLPVQAVIAGGRVVVRDGRLMTVDEQAILEEAREAAAALIARNASRFEYARAVAPAMEHMVNRAKEVYVSTHSGAVRSCSSN